MSIPTTATTPDLPTVPVLDAAAFRRKLAGLADPNVKTGALTRPVVRELANRFCSVLAHLFGDDLDRLTLWGRIGSALQTADAKVSDDDIDRYVTLCLEHVKADHGKVGACGALAAVMGTLNAGQPEDRLAFLRHVATHRYSVLVHAKARWEQVKNKEIEL